MNFGFTSCRRAPQNAVVCPHVDLRHNDSQEIHAQRDVQPRLVGAHAIGCGRTWLVRRWPEKGRPKGRHSDATAGILEPGRRREKSRTKTHAPATRIRRIRRYLDRRQLLAASRAATWPERSGTDRADLRRVDGERQKARRESRRQGGQGQNLSTPHPAIGLVIQDEADRAEKMRTARWPSSSDAPRFNSPLDQRRLRLLNAICYGVAKAGVKAQLWRKEDQ